tara:strand:+ start:49 stop:924 length:876 start_codon:yes stop_codon:yes gene_type:complete
MDKNKAIDLNHLSILEVNGEGSFDLLQGQITCDVSKVSAKSSELGALCNAKGRILSSFNLCYLEDHSYALIGHKEALLKTEEELKKYSPFYKVGIKENTSFSFFGVDKITFENIYNEEVAQTENTIEINGCRFINYLGKKFLLAFCNEDKLTEFKNLFETTEEKNQWNLDEILCQNVEISEENIGKFTPHELNYDVNNRIDFDKGCYTGQEVVARMQYRSKNLPRLNIAESSDLEITEKMTLINKEDKKIGNLVKVVNLEKKSVCLISAKKKTYLESSFKVKETNSTLTIT